MFIDRLSPVLSQTAADRTAGPSHGLEVRRAFLSATFAAGRLCGERTTGSSAAPAVYSVDGTMLDGTGNNVIDRAWSCHVMALVRNARAQSRPRIFAGRRRMKSP